MAAGLAYGAGLCAASVCLMASFHPRRLSSPYWSGVPWLRTDTCGVVCFFVAAVAFTTSGYLRPAGPGPAPQDSGVRRSLALAISRTGLVFATGLVAYLSTNAVTHPWTLSLPATHLARWPTEGTLRALSVVVCAVAAGAMRFVPNFQPGAQYGEPGRV